MENIIKHYTDEERVIIFTKELSYIDNRAIREICTKALCKVPDYFFEVAASSTGKYHPTYALGIGGLVRHTKAAVKIANDLLNLDIYGHLKHMKDYIISALILHDSYKLGISHSNYTVHDHPIIASKMLYTNIVNVEGSTIAEEDFYNKVAPLIESHMGQWTTAKYSMVVLPVPTTDAQVFVHMCDYLASRKYLEVVDTNM